ncbi:hypothetical protein DVS77_22485 [Mycolicibacterium moriokaense]|nr:hypothetical protein DVS77_22485 [Mycolicibacterium moriokaense]
MRLALMDIGLPRPKCGVPAVDQNEGAVVDLAYRVPKIGVVFADPQNDVLTRTGWTLIPGWGQTPRWVAHRVKTELKRRGYNLSTLDWLWRNGSQRIPRGGA